MSRIILKNKPLVEAIFELRWELQEPKPGIKIDPHYKIAIGRIYDRVKDEYPFHEQLVTSTMSDEISGYIVQHRFRKSKSGWPLIQIGPGIITLNDTDGYVWEDFKEKINNITEILFETYPDAQNLKVSEIILRYIDAIEFDYEKDNIFIFLREKMKINVDIHKKLFENTGVNQLPLAFDLRFSFPSEDPKGAVSFRFGRGKRNNTDALIWETMVHLFCEKVPILKEEIIKSIEDAHNLTNDWFFKIIEGDLLRRFK